ncbi:transposase, partial [Saccharopolyspora sp. NPDC000995]
TTAEDAPTAGVETSSTADEAAADHEAMAEPPAPGLEAESGLAARIRERFTDVQALRAQGKGIRAIARELRLDRKTARRFSLARSAEELVVKATSRASLLDEHKPYLNQRWNSGCVNISQLVREIRQRGYTGSPQTVYRCLRPFRATGRKVPGPEPAPLKIRQVTGWIMRDPDNLPGDDSQRLKAVLALCPQLQAARRHVGAFAIMIRDLRGDLLPEWIENVLADDLPALRSFVNGLRQDWNAVIAGLTLPYSNGSNEGAVNKIKLLKRMSYGRAGFPLLRKRILHAT